MKLAALLLACAALHAHEIGTTRVTANFTDQRYDFEIQTTSDQIPHDAEQFLQRLSLTFDNLETLPNIAFQKDSIHLTGDLPPNAKTFTWKFGWTFATYSLTAGNTIQWIEGGESSAPIPIVTTQHTTRWHTITQYLTLGFTHILPYGLDHMLFVLGIFLLTGRLRATLLPVTMFTIAHSISLALSMYGILTAPSSLVEPLIAISIAYVAIENVFLRDTRPWRTALVFAFGLLHGLGFAGALRELGLPRSEFAAALFSFNIGVEAAQFTVIAAAFVLLGRYARGPKYHARIATPASAAIACIALYWTIRRLAP